MERTNSLKNRMDIGAGETNRTPDLLITNELLYRLSYSSDPGLLPERRGS